jgi:hypothetical protein
MASLSLFQDGVSGVHKITRYNDEGLKRRENSLISFPLEIKYMYEVYTWSLKKLSLYLFLYLISLFATGHTDANAEHLSRKILYKFPTQVQIWPTQE